MVSSQKVAFAVVNLFSEQTLEALRRQEQSGLFSDAQLSQERELIPVGPLAYDLVIPHLAKLRPRHPYSSLGWGMVSPVRVASRSVWLPLPIQWMRT